MKFISLGSGSSGNCYYLSSENARILIDAGIGIRNLRRLLKEYDIDIQDIDAVFITHDHADHIRAVGTLGERVHLPIYSTRDIHDGIDRNYGVREKLRTSQRYFEKGKEWELNGMRINTFGVSHDSTECVGYVIDFLEQRFVIVTDCGQYNTTMQMYLSTANHLVIEANHDEQMLLNGPYPTYLKERILSPKGHQSNVTCGELIAKAWNPNLRNVFLCHLSHENNEPNLALNTIKDILLDEGIMPGEDVFVTPLERLKASPAYILNNQVIKQ